MIKMNKRILVARIPAFCMVLMLGGCGLLGGHGNLAAGQKFAANGQYRAAYIEAKKLLQHDEKDGAAWLLLGQATLMLGNPKDALNDLQHAQANGIPESQWAVPMGRTLLVLREYAALLKTIAPDAVTPATGRQDVLVLRGDAYLGLQQPDSARQSYQSALAMNADNPQALLGLAKAAAVENDPVSAGKYLQQALAIAPDDARAWIFKGDLAFNAQNYPEAETAYDKALGFKTHELLPQEEFYARARLAETQTQQDKLDTALANIQTLEKMSPEQPYPHYLHALVYYKQGHFNEATSQLQQVLKIVPENEPAQLLMGAVNYALGNFAQAEMHLSNVLGADQKNLEARKLLALTLYRQGQNRQALDMLRPAVPGHPSDAALLALIQKGVTEGPGTNLQAKAGETSTASPLDAQLVSAEKAINAGNEAEALRLLRELPAGNASLESQRYTMMVMAYLRAKQPDKAVSAAAEYLHKNPKNTAAHLLYGTALVADGKRAQARAEYTEAYKLDPENLAALMSLGGLDAVEGHYQDATNRYQTVLKADPQNAAAMTALGRIAAAQNNQAQAVSWFKQAIHAAPKTGVAYLDLIQLYTRTGQFSDAVNTAKSFADSAPDNPAALNALGAAQLDAGQYQDALQPLQQAVKAAPQATLYRLNLARALILDKRYTDAENNLHQVIQSAPDQVAAVALLAFLKLQNGDMPAALSLAQNLQKQTGTRAAGLALEGDLYMNKKRYAQAAQAYQSSLKLAYVKPLVIKTFMAQDNGNEKDATDVLRTWLGKHPDDAPTRMLLAQFYLDHGSNKLAAEQYQRVLNDYPSDVNALNNLAWIYAQQDNPRALTLAERAYKLAPQSAAVQDTYGWTLIVNGRAAQALPILTQAAKNAPTVPAIQYHLAVAQARTGDKSGARAILTVLLKSSTDFPDKPEAEKLYRELGGA